MIERLAIALSKEWCNTRVVEESKAALYRYGLELIFSSVANIIVIIGISILMGYRWAFFPVLLSFVPLRAFAGGYHAPTHWACILLCGILYCISLYITINIDEKASSVFCNCVSFAGLVELLLLSPVEATNKPLSSYERQRNRAISMSIGIILVVLSLCFSVIGVVDSFFVKMLYSGEIMAMAFLFFGFVKKKASVK